MTVCILCDADVTERPSVRVDFEGRVEEVCTDCLEKADEPDIQVRPFDREGDPAWNGAFNAW